MHWAQVNATVAEILDGKIADDAASDRAGRARGLLFEFAQGFFLLQGGALPPPPLPTVAPTRVPTVHSLPHSGTITAATLRLCEFFQGLRQHAPAHPHLDVRPPPLPHSY